MMHTAHLAALLASFLLLLSPTHATLECYDFSGTAPGETFDETAFHAAIQDFSTMDSRSYLKVVHERQNPMAWISGGGANRVNKCAGEHGALTFMSVDSKPDGSSRSTIMGDFKGLRIQFKEANFIEQFRITLADAGDWDPKRVARSNNLGVGVVRMCGYSAINDPDSLVMCNRFVIGKLSSQNDGCAKHISTEVIAPLGNIMEVAIFFEVRNQNTDALILDHLFDPNYGITELCWPGAAQPETVVVETAEYDIVTPAPAIVLTEFGDGSINVTLTKRPIGTTTITVALPDGVHVSPCELHLDRHNYASGVTLNINVNEEWSGGHLQLTANNPDMIGYNGVTATLLPQLSSPSMSGALTKCKGWGDPHFTTFDGKKHNNYLPGDHTWVGTMDNRLTVQGRQVKCARAACTIGMVVKFKHSVAAVFVTETGGTRVTILSEDSPDLSIVAVSEGEVKFLLEGGGFVSAKVGYSGMLKSDILKWVTVALPDTYQSKVEGFCGNFNQDKTDDPSSVPARGKRGTDWASEPESQYSLVGTNESLFTHPDSLAWVAPQKVSFKACNVPEDPNDITDIIKNATELDPPVCKPFDPNDIPDVPDCASDIFTATADLENPHVCDVLVQLMDTLSAEVVEPYIIACKEDVCLTGDDSYVADALEALKAEESEEDKELADEVFPCLLNCSFRGECQDSVCQCKPGFSGDACEYKGAQDCSVDPLTISVTLDSFVQSAENTSYVVNVQNRDPSLRITCDITMVKTGKHYVSSTMSLGSDAVICTVPDTTDEEVMLIKLVEGGSCLSNTIKLGGRTDYNYVVDCITGRYYACRIGGHCTTKQWDGPWSAMTHQGSSLVGSIIGITDEGQLLLKRNGDNAVYQTIDAGATLAEFDYDSHTTPMRERAQYHSETSANAQWAPSGECNGQDYEVTEEVHNIHLCVPEGGSWFVSADATREKIYFCKGDSSLQTCSYTDSTRRSAGNANPTLMPRDTIPSDFDVVMSSSYEEWEVPSTSIQTPDGFTMEANHDSVTFTKGDLTEFIPWCCKCLWD